MAPRKIEKITQRYPLKYRGSLFWFIFFLIIFFPIAIILFIKNATILKEDHYYSFNYNGAYGWLFFWVILFFPIAIILLFINGVDIIEER